jgi:hypothetical protein
MPMFPLKLYGMLEDADKDSFENIVSWIDDGSSFRVHDRDGFVTCILPKYFKNQSRYKSFQRQLNLYHFKTKKQERKEIRGKKQEKQLPSLLVSGCVPVLFLFRPLSLLLTLILILHLSHRYHIASVPASWTSKSL